MKKLLLTLVFIITLTSTYTFAQEAPTLTKLTDNIYAYIDIKRADPSANSFGANCGVIIGSEAVLVVDTLISSKHAKHLIKQIKNITDKPIKYAVNTHHHLDHSWGNSEFAKLGAIILGHDNAPLTEKQINDSMANTTMFGLTPEDLIDTAAKNPDITFSESMIIDLGDIHVELEFLGPAHTVDSIVVFVKEESILFVGDIIFNKYHPYTGDGNIPNWIDVLQKIHKASAKMVIPGHGPAVSKQDIKDMIAYLRKFDREAKKLTKGKTQADAPAIAEELIQKLPNQKRTELPSIVQMNLQMKYLPQEETTKEGYE